MAPKRPQVLVTGQGTSHSSPVPDQALLRSQCKALQRGRGNATVSPWAPQGGKHAWAGDGEPAFLLLKGGVGPGARGLSTCTLTQVSCLSVNIQLQQ